MRAAAAIFACGTAALCAEVPDRWVDALAQVETGGVSRSGDGGRARGLFQFHRAAWSTVNKIRASHQLRTFDYPWSTDPAVATMYAQTWLTYLKVRLHKETGDEPSPAQVYLAHNMGFDGFARIGFDPDRAPAARRDAAFRFQNLCEKTK